MMDETFMRMCREATEIQDQWEPKNGDQFVFEEEIYFVGNFMGDGIVLYKEDEMKNTDGKIIREYSNAFREFRCYEWEDEFVCNKPDALWLPRQEDLQNIYLNHLRKQLKHPKIIQLDGFLLFPMADWYNSPKHAKLTITQAWLCFVMETCYNKTWNGNTWEVI